MPTIEQLVQSIEARIRELNTEIASLEDARSELASNGSSPAKPREPKAKPAAGRQARTRTPRRTTTSKPTVLLAENAEQMLAESDGLSTAALAEQAGARRDQVLALLRELETAGRVRRTGSRRGTRWHLITDEDRIRARAAELAARSRRHTS